MPATPKIERHPLQPFLPDNARLLMLGSFPPPKVGEYIDTTFAARTIRFWRMPSTSRAYPLSFDKKAAAYHRMFHTLLTPSNE